MLIANLLLILSILVLKTGKRKFIELSIFFSLFLLLLFFDLLFIIANNLSGNGIDDSVIYHLRYGLEGAGILDFSSFIFSILISSAVLIVISYFIVYKIPGKNKTRSLSMIFIYIIFLISFVLHPTTNAFFNNFLPNIIKTEFDEKVYKDFLNHYKEPSIKEVGERKNLVFIYTEGVEQTHLDNNLFPGLTPNLNALQKESIYFTNITSTIGSRFTAGGMVASQCGIPLLSPSHLNAFENSDTFLPGVRCLAELLKEKNYRTVYYGGANLDFAGKGKFLSTHGFDELHGKEDLIKNVKDPEYVSWWGLYDDTTLDFAHKKFDSLSESKDNFALFILTLDAHHPWGNPSESCSNETYNNNEVEILSGVKCTDKLVSELVTKIQNSKYGDDTVIVVASDHLTLQSDATKILEKSEKGRNNLFMIFTTDNTLGENRRFGSTLDVGVTILPYIGFDGEIGLGRDLQSNEYNEGEIKYIHNNLKKWSPMFESFWDFPKLENDLSINVSTSTLGKENYVRIDNREFEIPVMVEFSKSLQTNLIFKYKKSDLINIDEEYSVFKNRINKNKNNDSVFISADLCSEVRNIYKDLPDDGICYLIGRGDKIIEGNSIFGKMNFTSDDVKEYFNK